jgi:hypothetical protein
VLKKIESRGKYIIYCVKMAQAWTMDMMDGVARLPSEVTRRFEESLAAALPVDLRSVLQETGAIIAGGSALRACYTEGWASTGDIDIYVNVRHVPRVMNALASLKSGLNSRRSNLYCNSFLVRNRIREVITLVDYNIDVVCVRNARKVTDVVSNFDLTMCQVWYDGLNMYATHPQHILEMKGELQGDYVDLYHMGNRFLLNRMEKYRGRGFTIELQEKSLFEKTCKMITSYFKLPPSRHALYPVFEEITERHKYMSGYDSEDCMDTSTLRLMSGKLCSKSLEAMIGDALISKYMNGQHKKFNELLTYIKTTDIDMASVRTHILDNIVNAELIYDMIASKKPRKKRLASLWDEILMKRALLNAMD